MSKNEKEMTGFINGVDTGLRVTGGVLAFIGQTVTDGIVIGTSVCRSAITGIEKEYLIEQTRSDVRNAQDKAVYLANKMVVDMKANYRKAKRKDEI